MSWKMDTGIDWEERERSMSIYRELRWWYSRNTNFDSNLILRKRVCPSVIKCISIRRQYMSSILSFRSLWDNSVLYHHSNKDMVPHDFSCTKWKEQFLPKSFVGSEICHWLKASGRLMTKWPKKIFSEFQL